MFKRVKKNWNMLWPLLALTVVAVIIFLERMGVAENFLKGDQENVQNERTRPTIEIPDTVLFVSRRESNSADFASEMEQILSDMRQSYEIVYVEDVEKEDFREQIAQYHKAVICFTDLDMMGEQISVLSDWVKQGGCMMNMATFDVCSNLQVIAGKMGILEGADSYGSVGGFYVDEEFMIGAKNRQFAYDDVYQSSLNVLLDQDCQTYVYAMDSDLPLLWEYDYGKGRFVIMNQTMTGKSARGILSAAYSLLDDISVYPVINASAFYLDDFPAPVPSGNGKYIKQEYGMDISNFYTNVWWEDILDWEDKYGIVHTGMIIEDYSDIVEEPFTRTESTERFRFFGNMLLNHGGELGFHGYNHMPLCLENFDYKGLYDGYTLWKSMEDMEKAITELGEFSSEIFPEQKFTVYVPPSNILSQEGRKALKESMPGIRAIASTYLPGDCVYEQEYGIGEDGLIETPRITSGAIMDDYTYLIAFSELNYHYVQSHFMHPDDVLDEDRGAALGWKKMHENLDQYLSYIYTAAPDIQNVTGSGMADAVENYAGLSIHRTEVENGIRFDLGGFYEKAYLMVRIAQPQEGRTLTVVGGTCEPLTGSLYLLTATQSHVEITYE